MISGYLEIVNCQNVTIKLKELVPTISIDLTTGCTLSLDSASSIKDICTAKCNKISIITKGSDLPYVLPVDLELILQDNWDANQYITRIGEDKKFMTEKILRVGGGYISTERENAIAEAKEKRNEEAMTKMLHSMLITKQSEKK